MSTAQGLLPGMSFNEKKFFSVIFRTSTNSSNCDQKGKNRFWLDSSQILWGKVTL